MVLLEAETMKNNDYQNRISASAATVVRKMSYKMFAAEALFCGILLYWGTFHVCCHINVFKKHNVC